MPRVQSKALIQSLCLSCLLLVTAVDHSPADEASSSTDSLQLDRRLLAEEIIGIHFTDAERDSMLPDLVDQLESYRALRLQKLPNDVPPAIVFQPLPLKRSAKTETSPISGEGKPIWSTPVEVHRPDDLSELSFASIGELGSLIRAGELTSVELTRMCIERLREYGPQLECVITVPEETALLQAVRADRELASGYDRGPLHGIPYGLKDLFAVRGTRTTWGAMPYREQVIHDTATVARLLEEAGAVLVAKLTLGSLAWGDVWFGGMTRNPWNMEEGSSGSSAGSAAAVAAGLVPFAIGTETWGSIVSPCTRCGATGLRPTFGRVSRAGAMSLSWSMDKVGPIARCVEDCAIVFDAIRGPDGRDQTVVDAPFPYRPLDDLRGVRVGYVGELFAEDYEGRPFDLAALDVLKELGADLVPIALPDYPVSDLAFILSAEAAAAFDELTRSGQDDLLVRQVRDAWPNVLRAARLIPAVEYLQANRVRWQLIQSMEDMFKEIDLYVGPTFRGDNLLRTNLTGHPMVVIPNGFSESNQPQSICFTGRLFDEALLLAVAGVYQEATGFHHHHPPGF